MVDESFEAAVTALERGAFACGLLAGLFVAMVVLLWAHYSPDTSWWSMGLIAALAAGLRVWHVRAMRRMDDANAD